MSKSKMIRVILVEPDKEPYVREISNSLNSFQNIVGGLIEYINLENNVDIICNDEGKMMGFDFNRIIKNDVIAGNFIIAGVNLKTGNIISIPKNKIENYLEMFSLENHKKQIDYLKAEFVESQELAFMKFLPLENEKE